MKKRLISFSHENLGSLSFPTITIGFKQVHFIRLVLVACKVGDKQSWHVDTMWSFCAKKLTNVALR